MQKKLVLPLRGSCLCGAVNVCASSTPILTLACHCHDCQKLTASTYSLTSIFRSTDLTIQGGNLILGGRKNNQRQHYFCGDCLTFMYTQIEGKDERLNVRTSNFDQAAALTPFVELMTEQKQPWAATPAIHSFNSFPKSSEEFDALVAEYKEWSQA